MEASRPARLCRWRSKNIKPADSRYDRGTSGGQVTRLAPYFPKSHGKPRVDDRRVLSGIIFVNRNGLSTGVLRRHPGQDP